MNRKLWLCTFIVLNLSISSLVYGMQEVTPKNRMQRRNNSDRSSTLTGLEEGPQGISADVARSEPVDSDRESLRLAVNYKNCNGEEEKALCTANMVTMSVSCGIGCLMGCCIGSVCK